jgi:hypothetical protein
MNFVSPQTRNRFRKSLHSFRKRACTTGGRFPGSLKKKFVSIFYTPTITTHRTGSGLKTVGSGRAQVGLGLGSGRARVGLRSGTGWAQVGLGLGLKTLGLGRAQVGLGSGSGRTLVRLRALNFGSGLFWA